MMNLGKKVYKKIKSKFIKIYLRTIYKGNSLKDQLAIKFEPYDKLSDKTKFSLNDAFNQVFGRTLKENDTKYARANWVVLGLLGERIVSFCFIIKASVHFDGKLVRVGGVGGVGTLCPYRGLGFAQSIINKVNHFLSKSSNMDCGLLVCNDKLVPFYKQFDWYEVDSQLYYGQNNERKLTKLRVMLKNRRKKFRPKIIKVNGEIW